MRLLDSDALGMFCVGAFLATRMCLQAQIRVDDAQSSLCLPCADIRERTDRRIKWIPALATLPMLGKTFTSEALFVESCYPHSETEEGVQEKNI